MTEKIRRCGSLMVVLTLVVVQFVGAIHTIVNPKV